ncbi:MAG: hypothetical protein ABIM99_04390 [Candidatus Dojkabacteria bacterium]
MASLYVTANNARKVVVVILGVFVLIILADIFIKVANNPGTTVANNRFYLDPDRKLGDVSAPNIPGIELDNKNIPIVQESVHPTFPDVSYIYAVDKPSEKSDTFEKASKTAAALGFSATGLKNLGNNDYKWSITDQTKTLSYNLLSQIWSLSTIYENNTDAKKRKTIMSTTSSYADKLPSVLDSLLFNTGLGMTGAKVDSRFIIRTDQGDIKETQDSKLANYVKLNAFRKLPQSDLKETKDQPKLATGQIKPQATNGYVYTSDPRVGEFSSTVSNDLSNLSRDVFEMKFVNYTYGLKGSYFVVTPEEAFNRIQNKQGALVGLSAEGTDYFEQYTKIEVNRFIVDARKTELGFYQPDEWTGYVYPIYILTGRAELSDGRLAKFTFFVDAVKRLNN